SYILIQMGEKSSINNRNSCISWKLGKNLYAFKWNRTKMLLRTFVRGDRMTPRKHKPSPKLMYQDPAFMESPAARPMRMMAEYFDPLTRLRREHIGDTIVMFGSARILPHDRAVAKLKRLQSNKSRKNDPMHRAEVRTAKANLEMSRYYEEARELARRITAWSLTLGEH